ncbi:glycosyltransferase family 25 protein [Helicobacter felis]|uniref:Beta-1,4-galactosyltransferase n=1 Tax=Helicobacter felis (strain ATCC 49179 / CCUG 28539 / NCTC 12436 / CS1) TaxID=936155 RepID=E7ACU8_HELFC|nr:glycosyltransferase family 25 protein [Helicobacter felis]CBY82278.1 Beta-1,4-galactosyltransferase [Helicobacter felis ATCC 49179]
MRIFIIHLSKATCTQWGLKERNIEGLLQSLEQNKHPVEVFEAIYSQTSEGLHPLVAKHLHPFFIHPSVQASTPKNWLSYLQACWYAFQQEGVPMSLGELGCFASHYALWQRCVALQEPICILEDDIALEPHFVENLDYIESYIPRLHWVRLMHLFDYPLETTPILGVFEIKPFTWGSGTQGYIITPKAASKFLKASQKWVMPVDCVMENTYLHGVKNYVIKPFVIRENSTTGNITRDRNVTCPAPLRFFKKLHPYYVRFQQRK